MQHSQVEIFCTECTMYTPAVSFWCLVLANMKHRSEQKEYNLTIMHQFSVCGFVCLSAIQICAAARIDSKRSMPVRGAFSQGTAVQVPALLQKIAKDFSSAGRDNILFDIIRSPLRIPVRPKNVTSHPVGSAHVLTTPQHKNQIVLLCLHNTLHLQSFLVPNPTVLRPLTKKYFRACSHCQC